MVGLATGLAEAGHVPFVYSIRTFASMRPYEFIRNGPLLHSLPVHIIGRREPRLRAQRRHPLRARGRRAMRAQPDMTIIAPADPAQAVAATHASSAIKGPIYFRIGKTNTAIAELNGCFELGRLGADPEKAATWRSSRSAASPARP